MVFNIITGNVIEADGEPLPDRSLRNLYEKLLSALFYRGLEDELRLVRKWRTLAIEGKLTPDMVRFK